VDGHGLFKARPDFYLDIGRIGVAAFFSISGYVIPFSVPRGQRPVSRFWISRFFRLWPAYWVSILFTLMVGASLIPITVKNLVFNFTMLQKFCGVGDMVGPFWTLQIELIFYGLVTAMIVVGWVNVASRYRMIFYTLIGLTLALAIARNVMHIRIPLAIPMGLTLMFLTAYVRNCKLQKKNYVAATVPLYLVSLIAICIIGYSGNLGGTDDPYRWILAYSLGLGIFFVFEAISSIPAALVFLGTISYSIYLLFSGVVKLGELWLGTDPNRLLRLVFMLSVTITLACVCYFVVERPFHELGKRLAKKLA
jgi:peptidoglycan/LPS O-acetylase OafA/YrhL